MRTKKKQDANRRAVLIAGSASAVAFAFLSAETAWTAIAPGVREQQSAELARTLKPIPDEEWQMIAGERASQKYSIVRGDTLYDISRRLFGDARYWPKIWALNNNSITNPHLISPGREIAFLPGTGVSLPAVAIGSLENRTAEPARSGFSQEIPSKTGAKPRSSEWRRLPPQEWEQVSIALPPEVDPLGFDTNTKISFGQGQNGFELGVLVQSERIDPLGEITGSNDDVGMLSPENQIFIESDGNLHVGETYDITSSPAVLKTSLFGRTGYAYPLVGTVRIIGVRDEVFVGLILSARDKIRRGDLLINRTPRVKIHEPVAGPGPMEATLFFDKTSSSFVTAQHKQVFVDRGTDDGVQAGMVFRYFDYFDPVTKKQISESGLRANGDVMIVQVSPRFSSGIVISSRETLPEKATVSLLTDVSEVFGKDGRSGLDLFSTETAPVSPQEIDTLEQLEGGAGIGKGEARELRQLEEWQETPAIPEGTEPEATLEPTLEPLPDEPAPSQPEPELEAPAPSDIPSDETEAPVLEAPPAEEEEELAPPPPPPTAPESSSEEFPAPPELE
ncbi:MAG: hypothetical protein A2X94_06985 [Bdellovibrionales bacterium GWB1_55_8]|nr:MAG: hypothetical protein A2X94_06985 [Bdellovibrionales bacterium GWB1_55_8]